MLEAYRLMREGLASEGPQANRWQQAGEAGTRAHQLGVRSFGPRRRAVAVSGPKGASGNQEPEIKTPAWCTGLDIAKPEYSPTSPAAAEEVPPQASVVADFLSVRTRPISSAPAPEKAEDPMYSLAYIARG